VTDPKLLADIAREVREPLNNIIGFCDLMVRGRTGPLTDSQRGCLTGVLASARQMVQLLNDFVELAQIDAGLVELSEEPIDLRLLVTEMADLLAVAARRKRIEIDLALSADLPSVVGDARRLRQLLSHYVSHAIEATPQDGRIAVRVAREGDDRYRIEVEDSRAAAPDPFGWAGQIGCIELALAHALVEAQGGQAGARGVPGRGLVRTAVLPSRAPAAGLTPTVAAAGGPARC
jgi:signal transduction histidine kinase